MVGRVMRLAAGIERDCVVRLDLEVAAGPSLFRICGLLM